MRSKPVLASFLAVVIMGAVPLVVGTREPHAGEARRSSADQELRALPCHRHGRSEPASGSTAVSNALAQVSGRGTCRSLGGRSVRRTPGHAPVYLRTAGRGGDHRLSQIDPGTLKTGPCNCRDWRLRPRSRSRAGKMRKMPPVESTGAGDVHCGDNGPRRRRARLRTESAVRARSGGRGFRQRSSASRACRSGRPSRPEAL